MRIYQFNKNKMHFVLFLMFCKSLAIQLQIDPRFQLSYTILDQTFIRFELNCQTKFWCGIGFGDSMTNADIITISQTSPGIIEAFDQMSKPTSQQIPPLTDSIQDISLEIGYSSGDSIYASLIRKFQTDDPSDYVIPLLEQIPMIYAIGDSAIDQKHAVSGVFQINFGGSTPKCHYTCVSCTGPLTTDCLTCSANSITPLNGYCEESDLVRPLASKDIISDDFVMYWGYDTNSIILKFEVSKCDWFGVGFGEDMIKTDMLLFRHIEFIEATFKRYSIEVHDMWADGNQVPDDDTMRTGGTYDWELLGYKFRKNQIEVKVRRLLDTQDPFDFVFNKSNIRIAYAFGNGTSYKYHGANRGVLTMELSQIDTRNLLTSWGNFIYRGHTVLLFVFWGIVSDIGVFFARQLKSYPKYAKVHGMIFLFQSLITYFFVFAMIQYNKDRIQEIGEETDTIIAHFAIGVIIIVIMTMQLFFGMMVKNNLESLNGSERVYRLKRIHQIFGYLLYLITKLNVAIGVQIYQPDYTFWFFAYYILLFLIRFTIEMLYTFEISMFARRRVTYSYVESDKNYMYQELIDKLNTNVPRYDILKGFPRLRYVILREAIYDISDFNHPGGQFIMDAIKGREIGRYFYGGSPVEKLDIVPHKHSEFAINYIETRYIGDLRNECCPILYHSDGDERNVTSTDRKIWKFKESRKISAFCSLFIFQSNYFSVNQQMKGVSWFGRYFYIKPYASGLLITERPYTVILCLSDNNIQYRQRIIDYFKTNIIEAQSHNFHSTPSNEDIKFNNTLCFLIKKQPYSMNMSKFIHDNFHKPYEITGPYGIGLELDESSNGIHYIFCNGTGILPFLDVFDFLLRKALFTVLYDRCGSKVADSMNATQENYLNTFGPDFQIFLCGAFKNKSEFHGYPIIQDLFFICRSFQLNYFDMAVRLSEKPDIQEQGFDIQFVQNMIKYAPTKVYLCGSPAFEEDVHELLKSVGVSKRNIVHV